MSQSRAVLLGVGIFVAALALCVALFLAFDVDTLYLVGPAIAVGVASYSGTRARCETTRTQRGDPSAGRRPYHGS